MYFRASLPLNHLIPSVLFSNENFRTKIDPAVGVFGRVSIGSETIRRA